MSTRVFKRIYICLGACKRGFRAIGRDLLGVDGAFMKEPAIGHLLTAVGLDSNNGIYPVAYAIVESECYDSWCWFLELVASDLELDEMCNFTFISDRQKVLVSAVAKVFPVAEHRFCLRHIHENMKKNWRGVAYKNHLWACATATTVPQFEKKMALLKEFSEPAYVYLSKIPPAQWARSHFTGRALSDILLNNICEVLNRWLCEARDKPIITALEYIRQYLMKRIANVITAISKCNTPLTLGATKVFDKVKKEAMKCDVIWNGDEKYQVNGHHDDQVVVDMGAKNCSCRKWDLTGIPCKHAVAALLNMACYSQEVFLEKWVHPVYWVSTWKSTYSHTINPVRGKSEWTKSPIPTTLIPPKFHATPGRPKKNRKKSLDEKDEMVTNGKLTRKGKTIKCGDCGTYGHNKRGCTKDKPTPSLKRKGGDGDGNGRNKKVKAATSDV
ncbi:uncharacterized protein [Rutidosis leptorrhynchoides]|uniref:uncharacterized protein n=1 Tax=Rutidosis leptorrhynchoides TaxID=125765 RepID=UPI003A9A16A2